MGQWWSSLNTVQQVFACMAIPATVIMVVQSILLLFGIGDGVSEHDFDAADHDFDHGAADHDGGLTLFSVRGIVAFFAVGGWAGIAMIGLGLNTVISILISFALGTASLLGIGFMLKGAKKLQYNGTLDLKNCIDKTGKVYIRIPAKENGTGKINVTVQGQLRELEAVTSENEDITPGQFVTVTGIKNDDTLVVVRQS